MSIDPGLAITPPPGRPGISQFVYANGLWRVVAGVDQGNGTAALLVAGAGISPSATSIQLMDGSSSQLAKVNSDGSILVTVTNPSSGGGSSGSTDVTDRAARQLGHVTVDSTPAPPHLSSTTDSVTVGNFPSTQPVTGTVAVSSIPAPPHLAASTDSVTATLSGTPTVNVVNGLVPKVFDAIALTYNSDGTLATAVYTAAGTTVATLTLSYTSGVLTNVARS